MIAQVNVKAYRPRRVHTLPRQRVAAGSSLRLPAKELRNGLAAMAGLALCVLAMTGSFVQWQVGRVQLQTDKLSMEYKALNEEHAQLLATRKQLSSQTRIQIVAGEKLGLVMPGKNQVHRM